MAHLFDPIEVGRLTLKNRIVMPPMDMELATTAGEVTDDTIRHYMEHARGGVAIIITEHCYVSPEGRFAPKQLGIHDASMIPGLARLAETIVGMGVPIVAQISHCGARTTMEASVLTPVSPSGVNVAGANVEPRELSGEEILEIADAFVAAAVRAKKAGFSGVEVHGAHGFLLNQFASPITNHRGDEYGGSLENRMRLSLEIVRRVKAELGDEMLLAFRLGADDMMKGGFTIDEAKTAAVWLEDAGVQLMDVSGGVCGSRLPEAEAGFFVPLAAQIKAVVTCPVIGVGGIVDPVFAGGVVSEGKADLVAIGRALLKSPDWPMEAARELGL